ncbi:MAG: hypothetical protein ACRYF4_11595 [Janthinobacterium lividum]
MKIKARCILFTLLSVGTVAACAQALPPARYPLSTESIARALRADGLGVQPDDIRILTQASAAIDDPALQVLGADRMPDGHLRMRLRCQKAGECLPFSVAIDASKVRPAVVAKGLPVQPVVSSILEARLALPQPSLPPSTPVVAMAAIHAGTKLTLLMDDGHMHIHLPVVALDNSNAGGQLRVCTPDHKRTFRATAIDVNTVRGTAE